MIAYRQATQADAPAVLSLLEEIMEHHGVVPPARERLASIVSTHYRSAGPLFPGRRGRRGRSRAGGRRPAAGARGRIVGMCALLFTISTWSAAPVCELQDVVVTEAHRRGDVGRGLIAAAEEIARARGCAACFLLAESWNLGAHAFYRSLGLQEKTCLYFERDLSGGAAV